MILSPSLPDPPADDRAHSERLVAHIITQIRAAGGWLPFADYMHQALYAPGLGYYSAGSRKLGRNGDFTTAPQISPLFGAALARQAAQVMRASGPDILELGAGSGALAAAILAALSESAQLPERYLILEVSADLRERQRELIDEQVPHLARRVHWLDRLPDTFSGLIVANELLDAMPVHVFDWREEDGSDEAATDEVVEKGGVHEQGVAISSTGALEWASRPARGALREGVQGLARTWQWATPYRSEIGLIAQAFIATIARVLERGAALFIDYGFVAREFYHPQRSMGTLRCHYRHRAHDDPFYLPGLCDITAHVDFSAIAEQGTRAGLQLAGFTTQAHLLINCGITDLLLRTPPTDTARYLPQANAVQRLLSPAEMGELFKAIAFSKNFDEPLLGFAAGDRRGTL